MLTYLGFAAPYLMTLAASYAVLLLIASGSALLTAVVVRRAARTASAPAAEVQRIV